MFQCDSWQYWQVFTYEPEHIRVTRSFVMGILKQPCLKMNMKYSNCAGKTTSIGSILRFLHISSYGISKLATEWVISFKSHQFDWLNLKLIAKQLPLQSKVWDTVRCSIQKSLEGCPAKPVAVFKIVKKFFMFIKKKL